MSTLKTSDYITAVAAGMNIRGAYSANETYRRTATKMDVVQYNGSLWGYIGASASSGNAPPSAGSTSNTYWTLLVAKGTDGTPALTRSIVSANTTAQAGYWYLCSDDITVTLPSSPTSGDTVKASTIGTADNVTVAPATGDTIEGDSSFVLDAVNNAVELIWNGSQWIIAEVIAN